MKKFVFILIISLFLAGNAFSQVANKHGKGAMLIGFDVGAAGTTNFTKILKSSASYSKGNYGLNFGAGVHFDYYLNNVFSLGTGLRYQPGIYLFLDKDYDFSKSTSFSDIAKSPICLTVPIMAHINVPVFQWLYAGAGVNLNFPIGSLLDSQIPVELGDFDTKGNFFIGIPIDLGFDFISAGQGGMRIFFRVTPEFHEGGTVVPIGFIWQVFNIKLR